MNLNFDQVAANIFDGVVTQKLDPGTVIAKIIEESFKFRVHSKKHPDYTGKILMTLREQFGGHKK
jgi:6-phosphogluconate dehydrogenase (decarboxylating)